jgi:hypothetical protein
MKIARNVFGALFLCTLLAGCGSSGGSTASPSVVPLATAPAAAVTASGAGALVVHPSIDPRYMIALETPIRMTENGGGTADWGFARMSLFLHGVEIERSEMSATEIQAKGWGHMTANSSASHTVVFRFNADDFDGIVMTLGFTDARDGRAFNVDVSGSTFTDVGMSFTPMSLPHAPERM